MTDPIVIIGAGHAAIRAALALREAQFQGSITMIAEEGAALPYERPPLSKWSRASMDFLKPIVPLAQLDDAQILRVSARVERLDKFNKYVYLENGDSFRYSKLLLATGATPHRLPSTLSTHSPILYLRDVADANRIKYAAQDAIQAVVIGGGFIGLELAASLRLNNVGVHVVDTAERLLSRAVSTTVSGIVQRLHVQHGVQFSLGTQLGEFSGPPTVIELENSDSIHADVVIAGVGSVPEVELAQQAGLEVQNGVKVDTYLRSSDPDIFAAGDCCTFPLYGNGGHATRLESWQSAGDQGTLAGRNMVNENLSSYTSVPWFWSEQYDHVLQVAGLPDKDMEFIERPYGDTHHVSFGINPDGSLGYVCGIAPGLKIAKDVRFSMKLIESSKPVKKRDLADPETALKTLC